MPQLLAGFILYFDFMDPEMRIDSNPERLLSFLPISKYPGRTIRVADTYNFPLRKKNAFWR
jgi:hypothetical protein